jgi:uncharacterized membrane protein
MESLFTLPDAWVGLRSCFRPATYAHYDGSIYRHFACCLGDTLASELGILSKSPPILITTLKVVPPGTNGLSPFMRLF